MRSFLVSVPADFGSTNFSSIPHGCTKVDLVSIRLTMAIGWSDISLLNSLFNLSSTFEPGGKTSDAVKNQLYVNVIFKPFLSSSTSTDGRRRSRAGVFKVATEEPPCGTLNINKALEFSTIRLRSSSLDLEANKEKN